MQASRRRFLITAGGVGLLVTVAGCLDDDAAIEPDEAASSPTPTPGSTPQVTPTPEDSTDEGTPDAEPPLPPGLTEDGPDVDQLADAISTVVESDSWEWTALAEVPDGDGEIAESAGRQIRGDSSDRTGTWIHFGHEGPLSEVLEAEEVSKSYVEDERSYDVHNFVHVEIGGRVYDHLFRFTVEQGLPELARIVDEIGWSTPEWNAERERFVLTGVDFDATHDPEVEDALLEVTEEGMATRLAGTWHDQGDLIDADIRFESAVSVETPSWFLDATDTGRPPRVRETNLDEWSEVWVRVTPKITEEGSIMSVTIGNDGVEEIEVADVDIKLLDSDNDVIRTESIRAEGLKRMDYKSTELEFEDGFGDIVAYDVVVQDVEHAE